MRRPPTVGEERRLWALALLTLAILIAAEWVAARGGADHGAVLGVRFPPATLDHARPRADGVPAAVNRFLRRLIDGSAVDAEDVDRDGTAAGERLAPAPREDTYAAREESFTETRVTPAARGCRPRRTRVSHDPCAHAPDEAARRRAEENAA